MSMDLNALGEVVAKVTGTSPKSAVHARVLREDIRDATELARRVAADPPVQGWLVGQSGHYLILDGTLPDDRWLEGEWIARSGQSWQLRDVPGGWVLLRIEEGEGDPCLVFERQHLPTRGAPGALQWRVYHRIDGLQIAPAFAAFRGFQTSPIKEDRP
jgi:hypothetical protein